LQPVRIIGFADRDKADSEPARGFDFALRLVALIVLRGGIAAPAARQSRQGFERRSRTAEMIDKRPKRARADILAADEAQPVDPLLIRQADRFRFLAHPAPKTVSPCAGYAGFIAYIARQGRGNQMYRGCDRDLLTGQSHPLTATRPSLRHALHSRVLEQALETHSFRMQNLAKLLPVHVDDLDALQPFKSLAHELIENGTWQGVTVIGASAELPRSPAP
jgi:hypothetical protein